MTVTGPETAVAFDGRCGEPIGFSRWGDPVVDTYYDPETGVSTPITRLLTAREAAEKYGPMTSLRIGVNGGFKSVRYGDKTFVNRCVDPRRGGVPVDPACIQVDDYVTDQYECPKCGAAKGVRCEGVATRHRARTELAS